MIFAFPNPHVETVVKNSPPHRGNLRAKLVEQVLMEVQQRSVLFSDR
jgi:hypothetical protein